MVDRVVPLSSAQHKAPPDGGSERRFTLYVAAATFFLSTTGSILTVGLYVGQFSTTLSKLTEDRKQDRDDFKQQITVMTNEIFALNSTLTGVKTGLDSLSKALEIERQDRLNDEVNARRR